jgi:hypothetical protein
MCRSSKRKHLFKKNPAQHASDLQIMASVKEFAPWIKKKQARLYQG